MISSNSCQFPDLLDDDHWYLCIEIWKEALVVKIAPPAILRATHCVALQHVKIDELQKYALDNNNNNQYWVQIKI